MTLHRSIGTAVAVASLLAASMAQAESLVFTSSNVVTLPGAQVNGVPSTANACATKGLCAESLNFNTVAGGLVTATASSGGSGLTGLVYQSKEELNAGLGVAAGWMESGKFVIHDTNYSLDTHSETLTIAFANSVVLSAANFFPDDRSTYALTHELDAFDGFTVRVDGGAAVEYSFGKLGGQFVSFATPMTGKSFTFGYAQHKSPEDYYLGGLSFAAANPVPEPGTWALMGLGLGGLWLARRRRAT
ncbi:PEP-CTERM sorting domain-containing protein [Aquabacterium sp.]|uniref:PEP-CTERM sorting domain-containing protein n=1 Tax=Aquabacterium sp. TaxID=1872578 RepID=UPI002486EC62|nr:PEP-CTERM sorting domain-containing protein [Aquabacterium sp.]MDI1261016.1 PEP-CTERM sorting domain-containing protein [Aquabacterium sp.]